MPNEKAGIICIYSGSLLTELMWKTLWKMCKTLQSLQNSLVAKNYYNTSLYTKYGEYSVTDGFYASIYGYLRQKT